MKTKNNPPAQRRVMNPIRQGALVISALLIVVGIGVNLLAKNDYDQRVVIQENWQVVTGQVIKVESGLSITHGGQNTPTVEVYYPWLTVAYVFNDSRHTVTFEVQDHAYASQSQAITAHEMGENQPLYVNPDKPEDAVRYFEKPAANDWIVTFAIIDGVFLAIGALFLGIVWLITKAQPTILKEEGKGAKGTSTRL